MFYEMMEWMEDFDKEEIQGHQHSYQSTVDGSNVEEGTTSILLQLAGTI